MEPPKAVCFDLHGTLLDDTNRLVAIRRTCSEIATAWPDLDPARLLVANSQVWRTYWPSVEEQWTLGILDGAAVSLEAWRRALRACGCDDDSVARRASDIHRRLASATMRLYDDMSDLFDWLVKVRLPLALVTNGASDTQRAALRSLGIEHHFTAIVISGEVGLSKPDPAIFAIATARLGIEPTHAWHVGDSLRADVASAQAAGLTAVWLNRGHRSRADGDPTSDAEIRSLRELGGLVWAGTTPNVTAPSRAQGGGHVDPGCRVGRV